MKPRLKLSPVILPEGYELCARCGEMIFYGEDAAVSFTRLQGKRTFERVLFPQHLDTDKRPLILIPCAGGYTVRRMKPALIPRWLMVWNNENVPMRDNGWPEWITYVHARCPNGQEAQIQDEWSMVELQSLDTPDASGNEEKWEGYIRLSVELQDCYLGKNKRRATLPDDNASESDKFERLKHDGGAYRVACLDIENEGDTFVFARSLVTKNYIEEKAVEDLGQSIISTEPDMWPFCAVAGTMHTLGPAIWRLHTLEAFPVIPAIAAPRIIGEVYPKDEDRDTPAKALKVQERRGDARRVRKLAKGVHPSERDWTDLNGKLSWLAPHSQLRVRAPRFKINKKWYTPPLREWGPLGTGADGKPILPVVPVKHLGAEAPIIPRKERKTQYYGHQHPSCAVGMVEGEELHHMTDIRMEKRLQLTKLLPGLARQLRDFTIRQNALITHWPLWKNPQIGAKTSRLSRLGAPFPYVPPPTPPRVGGEYEYSYIHKTMWRLESCGCDLCLRAHNARLGTRLTAEDRAEMTQNRAILWA